MDSDIQTKSETATQLLMSQNIW